MKKINNPRLIVEFIAEDITGEKRSHLYLEPEIYVSSEQQVLFKKSIRRCGRKVPLAYITGKQYFMGDLFIIRPGVFIPRPETEILVEKALQFLEKISKNYPEKPLIVVDIGTGSGNIAISIAKRIENVFVYATDISTLALRVAKENARLHGVSQRINFLLGGLFSPLRKTGLNQKVDLLISNPPYVKRKQLGCLPEEVRKEPDFTLNGGEKGLAFYQKIIPASPQWLRKNGALMLEVGYNQAEQVRQIIYKVKKYHSLPQFFCDLEGNPRITVVQRN